ncbi:hypothetical protein B4100_3903 [Heyndrickxia coagulans]|nr:hypothetical protein B4100_3903 [Heyndrickxia coagulans]
MNTRRETRRQGTEPGFRLLPPDLMPARKRRSGGLLLRFEHIKSFGTHYLQLVANESWFTLDALTPGHA